VTGSRALLCAVLLWTGVARAQTPADPSTLQAHTKLWPVTLEVYAVAGVEPHGDRGNPVAFGAGSEVLWHGLVGGFASLLSSEGTPILAHTTGQIVNGQPQTLPSLADRISVPFGVVARPFSTLLPRSHAFVRRVLAGIGLQAGLTVEHVRTSDDSSTLVGFHGAASVEVPIWGGPVESGVTVRVMGRLLATQSATLDSRLTQFAFEPTVSGQFYVGLAYYP
jgi:hypothetical protein